MFDFQVSLASLQVRDERSTLVFDPSAALDASVDPSLFENIPMNRVSIPTRAFSTAAYMGSTPNMGSSTAVDVAAAVPYPTMARKAWFCAYCACLLAVA